MPYVKIIIDIIIICKFFFAFFQMFFPYSEYKPSVYSELGTFIHLTGKTLEENEPMIQSYVEKFNQTEPYVFVLTGKSNNYDLLENNAEKIRFRRSADSERKVYGLPADNPCAFITAGELICNEYEKNKKVKSTNYKLNITKSSANCGGDNERKNVSSMKLEWTANSGSEKLNLNFTFESTKSYVPIPMF